MPRPLRFCPAGHTVHVVQRGNNRNVCFTCDEDIAAYASCIHDGATRFGVAVHAWVFMTNHVHLLMTPATDNGISRVMQYVGRHFVQPFNRRYARTGSLFDGRFKSSLVQSDNYLLNCIRYIELNPVRAGMATDPGDYHWSSYRCHAFGQSAQIWSPHSEYLRLGTSPIDRATSYRLIVGERLSVEAIHKIRHCLNTGIVLGNEAFREQVAALRGER